MASRSWASREESGSTLASSDEQSLPDSKAQLAGRLAGEGDGGKPRDREGAAVRFGGRDHFDESAYEDRSLSGARAGVHDDVPLAFGDRCRARGLIRGRFLRRCGRIRAGSGHRQASSGSSSSSGSPSFNLRNAPSVPVAPSASSPERRKASSPQTGLKPQ